MLKPYISSNGLKVAHIATVDMSLRYLLLNQLLSIREEGFEVFGISSPGPYAEEITAAGIRFIPVKMSRRITPVHDLISLWRLYRIFRREQFTIVHTHNPKPGLLGQLAARLARVPIVVNTVHGFYFHENMHPWMRRFYIVMERIAAHCSDVILSQNSEDVRTAIVEHISAPKKLKYLGNGIDVGRFDPDNVSRQIALLKRRALGIQADAAVVGFVGRLVVEKGVLDLLQAAQLVLAHIPSTHFLFIGGVDDEKPDGVMPEVAEQYGVQDKCTFTGWRDDLPDLYSLMNVFVLPSYREGFPRSPMEASAMKVPCVVTDIRGCREVVNNGRNGLLVPLGNIPALADAIIEILTNPEKARQMGEEGRRMALERFDERIVFERVKCEYRRLLADRGLLAGLQ